MYFAFCFSPIKQHNAAKDLVHGPVADDIRYSQGLPVMKYAVMMVKPS
jgi:hypothetical protein